MFGIMDNDMLINKCSVDGCNNEKRRNGEKTLYCHMHYKRFLKNGDVGQHNNIRVFSYNGKICKIDNCGDLAKKKEMCIKHYDSQKGSTLSAQEIDNMKKDGCQACGSMSRLTLDHDHNCCPTGSSCSNCVRGILCHKCNTAAGLLDDDIDKMMSLASYILSKRSLLNYEYN